MSKLKDKFIGEEPLLSTVTPEGVVLVSDRAKALIPWLVATAFFMQMLDGTILNTALPAIATSFGANALSLHSVVIAYLLTVAMLVPATGWLADRFGIRRVFLFAIIAFTLGSLFCALSQSLNQLIAGRVIQGVGGAIMAPVGRLAILRITPRKDLIRVMSFIAIPGLLGPLMGPTVGGLLVEYASWHWIFIINIPVGALGIYLTLRHLPPLIISRVFKFDWLGFTLLAVLMLAFTMGMEGLGELQMSAYMYNGLFASAALALAIYIIYARKAAHPLFDLQVFKNRTFSIGIAGNLISRLGGGAMPFLMPLFLQIGLGFSPALAGMTMIPMPMGAIISKMFITKAVRRLGYRKMLLINTILLGCLLISFSQIRYYDNYYLLLLHLACFGIVNSTQFAIMNTSTLMNLSAAEASTGNGILSAIIQLSQSMGVSMGAFGLAFFMGYLGLQNEPPSPAALQAFGYTFIAMGCVTICSSFIFGMMPKALGREEASR